MAGKLFQRQIQSQFPIEALDAISIANQQTSCIVIFRLGGDGLERDFGANAGHVTKRDADPVFHAAGER